MYHRIRSSAGTLISNKNRSKRGKHLRKQQRLNDETFYDHDYESCPAEDFVEEVDIGAPVGTPGV